MRATARLAALALTLWAPTTSAADPPPAREPPAEPGEPDETDEPDAELEPDPHDDVPAAFDEDEHSPRPDAPLPPEGQALRPTLPFLERDLVQPRHRPAGRASAQVGLAEIDEDLFLELTLGTVIEVDRWRFAPRLPLRLRLWDEAPETDAVLREEDWDEASDWARVLGHVQYGRWGDALVLRYGELVDLSLGHGVLVNRYSNTIDLDHYQGGAYFFGDAGLVGGELLIEDLFAPELFGARAFVRPFDGAADLALPLRGFKVAFTFALDAFAPVAVDVGPAGLFSTPENDPVVLADRVLPMFALDFEVPVVSGPHFDLVPYFDLASLELDTIGVHLGAFANLRFTPAASLRLRLEYRFVGEDHVPGYVSPFYEIERHAWLGGEPKLAALDALQADEALGEAHHGVHLEADLRVDGVLGWSLVYTSNGRERHNDLLTRLRLPNLGPVRLGFFFARLGFENLDDLFAADRTLAGVSARVTFGSFFVRGRLQHEWRLRAGDDGRTGFETILDWDLGGGVLIEL